MESRTVKVVKVKLKAESNYTNTIADRANDDGDSLSLYNDGTLVGQIDKDGIEGWYIAEEIVSIPD